MEQTKNGWLLSFPIAAVLIIGIFLINNLLRTEDYNTKETLIVETVEADEEEVIDTRNNEISKEQYEEIEKLYKSGGEYTKTLIVFHTENSSLYRITNWEFNLIKRAYELDKLSGFSLSKPVKYYSYHPQYEYWRN